MDVWVSAFLNSLLTGVMLLFITNYVKKSGQETIKATDAEKRLVQKELMDLGSKFSSLELKQDRHDIGLQLVKERLTMVSQKQDDSGDRMFELITTVEDMRKEMHHGKVARR